MNLRVACQIAVITMASMLAVYCSSSEDGCGECPAGQVCVEGFCVAVDGGGVDTGTDTGVPYDAATDTYRPDTYRPDTRDTTAQDVPPDIDTTPPTVVSTNPADGATNVAVDVTIEIKFSESMKSQSFVIAGQHANISVKEMASGASVPLNAPLYNDSNRVLSIKPSKNLAPSSTFRVIIGNTVQDAIGNMMAQDHLFVFSTAAPSGLDKYLGIAEHFAPLIYQAVETDHPHYDMPTRFNFDGDYMGTNNRQSALSKPQLISGYVYTTVIESKSHFFVIYGFFYPFRNQIGQEQENDLSGAMVIVKKKEDGTHGEPFVAQLYYKNANNEYVDTYVTVDSGLPDPDTFGNVITAKLPRNLLFPGDRFTAYLTASSHAACMWEDEDDPWIPTGCSHKKSDKEIKPFYEMSYVKGSPGSPPQGGSGTTTYDLLELLTEWWVRRHDVGQAGMWGNTIEYTPPANRPGDGLFMPSTFTKDEGTYSGRPPFAWKHETGSVIDQLNRGVHFMDPAHAVKERLDWDEIATDYCFNPYLGIDNRGGSVECPQ